MGKTNDFTLRQRILTDGNIKRDIIELCSKTRNSCKCLNGSKCYAAFGDALEAVDRVKQVSSFVRKDNISLPKLLSPVSAETMGRQQGNKSVEAIE